MGATTDRDESMAYGSCAETCPEVFRMQNDIDFFFNRLPKALPLYHRFAEKVFTEIPSAQSRIQKSQIAFYDKHNFAFVWLPIRKMKNRPDIYIIVSFGLPCRLYSSRIIDSTEPYPDRWTHHVIIQDQREIDKELMNWVKQAHAFAVTK